jgi:hypothetical protein
MWAASFLVFLANPLVGTVLLLAAGITHYVKASKVDAEYAKRGELPPTQRLIDKWLDRQAKGGKPVKPAKYGMWRYGWLRWCAFWEDLTSHFHQARATYRQAVADAKANGKPPPPKPTQKELLSGWQWSLDNIEEPSPSPDSELSDTITYHWNCGLCRGSKGGYQSENESLAAAQKHIDDVHGGRGRVLDSTIGEIPDSADENLNGERPDTAPPSPTKPAAADQPQPTEPNEGDGMTAPTSTTPQQSGEVVGLTSAINYADAVAAAHAAHSLGGGEQYRASLGQANVGPETLQSAASAQEASELAAGAWRAHADKLREQLAAKEATTAETGSKDFLLAD